jgi:hypothetical protein
MESARIATLIVGLIGLCGLPAVAARPSAAGALRGPATPSSFAQTISPEILYPCEDCGGGDDNGCWGRYMVDEWRFCREDCNEEKFFYEDPEQADYWDGYYNNGPDSCGCMDEEYCNNPE